VAGKLKSAGFTVLTNTDEDSYVYVNVITGSLSTGSCVSRFDVTVYTHTTARLSYQPSAGPGPGVAPAQRRHQRRRRCRARCHRGQETCPSIWTSSSPGSRRQQVIVNRAFGRLWMSLFTTADAPTLRAVEPA
jgi:hypothetical protein